MAERQRPARALAGAVLAVVVIGAGIVGFVLLRGGDHPSTGPAAESSYTLATVTRGTLTVSSSIGGRLDHGPASSVPIRASGTVTWLPRSGRTIARGEALLRVDDRPVVLLYGRTPAFRALGEPAAGDPAGGAGADPVKATAGEPNPGGNPPTPVPMTGPDVRQLEKNLAALGYGGFTVDDTFTSGTAAAVRAWQTDLGIPATGRVEFGDVVFLPGPIRAVTDPAALGEPVSASAVQSTATRQTVTASAPADSVEWASPGAAVTVTLPDQRTAPGTVSSVGRAATGDSDGGGGPASLTVHVDLKHPGRVHESGPVTISYVARQVRDVLIVPVTALVALAEGGYGVQLADGTFVPATPGLYADGNVQIDGAVTSGTEIRVPQ